MQVVVVVGHVVRDRRHLRLGARMGVELEVMDGVVFGKRPGQLSGHGAVAPKGRSRPVMLGEPLERLPRQVQPVEFGVMPFEPGHDPDRLGVVVEAAMGRHEPRERVLAGMAEGRVAEIVGERERLGQFRVEPERASDRARDLRHLDRMGEPRAVVVALVLDEHLRLVLEPPEGRGMDDPVTVALEARPEGALLLGVEPPAACRGVRCIGRAHAAPPDCPVPGPV
jgi:hypothetical protein